MAKKGETIQLEVSKPDRGSFIKFDSEGQSEIRILVDASQRMKVEKLNAIPYGETFRISVLNGK